MCSSVYDIVSFSDLNREKGRSGEVKVVPLKCNQWLVGRVMTSGSVYM